VDDYNAILHRLERENRRLKILAVILMAALSASSLVAQLRSEPLARIEAREFVLVTEDGRARAVLNIAKESPTLSFIDPKTGDLGLLLGILPEGATLGVVQPNRGIRNYLSQQ
jgi:hypothetical protein